MIWAGRIGRTCYIDAAKMLNYKYLYSKHVMEHDFRAAD
jgi:hypothetical protein